MPVSSRALSGAIGVLALSHALGVLLLAVVGEVWQAKGSTALTINSPSVAKTRSSPSVAHTISLAPQYKLRKMSRVSAKKKGTFVGVLSRVSAENLGDGVAPKSVVSGCPNLS